MWHCSHHTAVDSGITTKKEAKDNVDIYVLSRLVLFIHSALLFIHGCQTLHYLLLEGLYNSSVKPHIFGGWGEE